MKNSRDIIDKDLEYICTSLKDELACLSGKRLLITGGAGFLGYYLVQAILHWDKRANEPQKIQLTVYDNYIRGVPAWLTKLEGDKNLTLVKHDITNPLPQDIGDFQYIIHAASIASPTYYRKYPIETMDANVDGLRYLLEYCREQKEKGKPIEKSTVTPLLKTFLLLRAIVAMFLVQARGPVMMNQNVTVRPFA
ncbi:MAG: NAD-dependent epimerase/dehydratase family protein [Candidatus Hermodarchaeia archaeon]|jgi:FlaA1/EpsC-like NDP-sugar epimerase